MHHGWPELTSRGGMARRLRSLDRIVVAACALALALGIFVLAVVGDSIGDTLLFLLVAPMALAAIAYGLKGGGGSTLLGSALATTWWVEKGYPGGASWYSCRIATYILVGAAFGWFVDSRRVLLRRIAHDTDLSLDLIATASFEGYFTRVNPAFTYALGYTARELTSRPFLDFVHPDDREPTLAEVERQTQAGEQVLRFQNRYRHKDGSYRWLEWTSRPDADSRTLVAVARDVTERKQLEQREHEYQAQLERAVRDRTQELQRRNEELDEARQETLRRLALAAEYRDDESYAHTERVGRAAALLATELGLADHEVALIREAAPLHDVGKLGVSDTVLLKPGKLTPAEFEHVKQHAQTGAAILSGSNSAVLKLAEEIASNHHEWWDGTGYPRGLQGDAIPLSARIVAVVDVFDALTHTRPYKEAWPVPEALAEIRRLCGRQLDPQVVDAFERLDAGQIAGLPDVGQSPRRRAVA